MRRRDLPRPRPTEAQLVGVELDPTTAAIARALHPDADIRAESFAHTRLPDAYFDLAVGNVPFADVRLHDPRHNPGAHSLHNHFILKSLHLTRPGGLVAVLSSHYTLDATNPAARREMSTLADLVGAVRLPTGAHRRAAGTDALMDLLILRRRHPDEPARDDELGEHPAGRCRRPPECGSTATWPSTRSASSASWQSDRACTAQTRCSPPARQPRGHAGAADRGARRARRDRA